MLSLLFCGLNSDFLAFSRLLLGNHKMSNYVTNCIWGAHNLFFFPSLLCTVSGWTLFFWRSIQINVTETHNGHHVTHLFEKCWCKHDTCKEGCTIVEKKKRITIFLLFRIDNNFFSKQIFITIIARNKRTGPKGYSSAVCKIGTSRLKED